MSADITKRLDALTRHVAALQELTQRQAELTAEALRRAGWQSDEEANQEAALQRVLKVTRTTGDVILGPWTGEVGFEVLYWIPFLEWLVAQGLDRRRLVVVSRGGAAPWYQRLTDRYVDLLDLVTPDEFRERTAGPKKQYDARRELDHELIAAVTERLGLNDVTVVHPSSMYRLFIGLWRKRATIDLVEAFTSHQPLMPPAPLTDADRPAGLPADFLVAKFYFSKAFPDTGANRRFVTDVLKSVSKRMPIALLSTSLRLDEHSDFQTQARSGLYVIDAHAVPQKNLELQTRWLCGARGFIGTYGGFSYVAPFHGVRSLSFFSRRGGFEHHHLQLAERVFDRLLPGGFLAIDRRAADLIEPAVERWTAPLEPPAAGGGPPTHEASADRRSLGEGGHASGLETVPT